METYLVDAFTTERFKGNSAGVVIDADSLSDFEMQQIAREINAAESAFAVKGQKGDYDVRFFTPSDEVPFCGHATVALFHTLASLGKIRTSSDGIRYTESTRAGMVPVKVRDSDGLIYVTMEQNNSEMSKPKIALAELLFALGLRESDSDHQFPFLVSKTINRHLIVPVTFQSLSRICCDFQKLTELLKKVDVITAHVFAKGSDQSSFSARNFAPHIGIPEDPATGSAAGAFGAYLHETKYVGDGQTNIKILQGAEMGRESHLTVCVHASNGKFEMVEIIGTAVQSFRLEEIKAKVSANNGLSSV